MTNFFLLKHLLNLFFSIIMRWSHLVACSGLGLPVWSYPVLEYWDYCYGLPYLAIFVVPVPT